jgi:hypothetical protein
LHSAFIGIRSASAVTVPDWLSWMADAASVAGLAITVAVWFQTKALRRAFALKGRLPELSLELGRASERILECLRLSTPDAQRSRSELARLSAILRNLLPKLTGSQRKPVERLIRKCEGGNRGVTFVRAAEQLRLTNDRMWEVYAGTQGLIEWLKQVEKDFKWG